MRIDASPHYIFARYFLPLMNSFFDVLTDPANYLNLFILIMMEIVLGIDNIIFIAIICGYLPNKRDQQRARFIGLSMALVVRIILLSFISYITQLKDPFWSPGGIDITGRGVILFAGGMFLIIKTSIEIYHKFKIADHEETAKSRMITMTNAILQITLIDIVFSFDSIITAVGLSNHVPIMIIAVIISMIVMLMFAPHVSKIIDRYPTIKMLALVFLIVIGIILVVEALESAIGHFMPEGIDIKSYAYIALAFSVIVEILNIRLNHVKEKRGRKPVE
jgi:predicted tellurium resistance membrane protein TerC